MDKQGYSLSRHEDRYAVSGKLTMYSVFQRENLFLCGIFSAERALIFRSKCLLDTISWLFQHFKKNEILNKSFSQENLSIKLTIDYEKHDHI
jgi:hypothetical protein